MDKTSASFLLQHPSHTKPKFHSNALPHDFFIIFFLYYQRKAKKAIPLPAKINIKRII